MSGNGVANSSKLQSLSRSRFEFVKPRIRTGSTRVTEITGCHPRSGKTLSVLVRDGVITRMDEVNEQRDLYLSAGFVDLQVNGFAGLDFNAADISVRTVVGMVEALLAHGITCFVPTIITASE